ncbi:MAG TPA: hypothetical protein DHW71_14645 [Gammaproteobacteria bacterium]|nr:hypothetical protein [Gammaproteobacteria bacterium]MEC8012467.1 hypothetical protein [Pseudomonadota bacterium]HBF07263.1 hypothetical protein [Gammaproteobacteria bacterium]HCK94231.1 hypothetical protein [Gammaproteobacteria bacterium]|tara:strand:+ start:436 stop:855 length:420 start_codon:yes stop_codon:yes gene_type:complete
MMAMSAAEKQRLNEGMKRVPAASWNGFRMLCHDWRLDREDGGALLRLGKLHMMGSWSLDHEMFLNQDQMQRLGYLLAVDYELRRLSADPLVIMRWLHLPRRTGRFVGKTPFSAMCRADTQDLGLMILELMDARNLLDLF